MAISWDTLRVGKKYYLKNYGEKSEFEVLEVIGKSDFKLKDLYTLESYMLSDLVRYGKGKDYDLQEL
ncbi:hypothetical protein QQ008_09040 [Fulvivirgaceae bacterium BMA10]|uniref:Uncharacterized protein n=1 Tax=Splendidivirga corallicola TaxID=3051826 RepID=A0ABT8KLB0_9BACT|nr:hypothetical protein [Fulvivirgaceae bacterium BMA10]